MRIESAGLTHVGMKRTHNEDSLFLLEEENLYVVADGMGGHASGEVASKMAVETVANFFKATATDEDITWPYKMEKGLSIDENRLVVSVKLANAKIFEVAQRTPKYRGMGTTVVGAFFRDSVVYCCHVGDSRAYRFRAGKLEQLTEDHSLLNDYIKMKKLTEEEIENFPHKNVIVRALGMKDTVLVDLIRERPQADDLYLLCSDGLSGMVTDDELAKILASEPDLNRAVQAMVQAANAAGGTDNITVVLAKYFDG